jgi:predicted nucleotidyltransferase component of viral defense system
MTGLYALQKRVWQQVFKHEQALGISQVLLCGGTALARFYLDHRVSYDLDFFVPTKFDPQVLQSQLKQHGLTLIDAHTESGENYCHQLKGLIRYGQDVVKVDFIEESYEGMFDVVFKEGQEWK